MVRELSYMIEKMDSGLSEYFVEETLAHEESNDEPFHELDPAWIRLEQIGGMIFTSICTVAMIVGVIVLWVNVGVGWILLSVILGALLALATLLYFTIAWPYKAFRHARWRLDSEGLEIRRGVIWRHDISIPLGRVQHADVLQGPLQRHFGVGKLTVHTAGTQNASIELDGLNHGLAVQLRDEIVKQKESVDVV